MIVSLLPFDPIYAEYLWMFFYEADYAHFSRRVNRYLTKMECIHLPEVIGREVLVALFEGKPCGVVTINYDEPGVAYVGGAIEKKYQGQKLAYFIGEATENYLFLKRNIEIIRTDVVGSDPHLGNALMKVGYQFCGEIPNMLKVNGVWESLKYYYKSIRK